MAKVKPGSFIVKLVLKENDTLSVDRVYRVRNNKEYDQWIITGGKLLTKRLNKGNIRYKNKPA